MDISRAGGIGPTPQFEDDEQSVKFAGAADGPEGKTWQHPTDSSSDGIHPGEEVGCSNETLRPADLDQPDMSELPHTSVHAGGLEQRLQSEVGGFSPDTGQFSPNKDEIPNLKSGAPKDFSPNRDAGGREAKTFSPNRNAGELTPDFRAGKGAANALPANFKVGPDKLKDPKDEPNGVRAPGEWFAEAKRTQI